MTYTKYVKNCHYLYFLFSLVFSCLTHASFATSDFYACQIEASITDVEQADFSNSQGQVRITFSPSKITEGECDLKLGESLTKEVDLEQKEAVSGLKEMAKEKSTIELDHSLFSSEDHDGQPLQIETWVLVNLDLDEVIIRRRGDDGHYR